MRGWSHWEDTKGMVTELRYTHTMHVLSEIAKRYGLELVGDGDTVVRGVCGLSDDLPGYLGYITKASQVEQAAASSLAAFVTPPNLSVADKPCLRHERPEVAIAHISNLFARHPRTSGPPIHPSAQIADDVILGEDVRVGACTVLSSGCRIGAGSHLMAGSVLLEDVSIGNDCIVYPNCVIGAGCELGDRVTLQPGAVIGGDGYGYVWDGEKHLKVPQLGNVIIESDVEIGANCAIDRGRFTATRIGRGTKIDNLVMVAHNVQVGDHCLLVAQTGISGSTRIGNHVTFAGQVGVVGHLNIADHVTVLGQSMVAKNIPEAGVYAGSPCRRADEWHKAVASFYRAGRKPRK